MQYGARKRMAGVKMRKKDDSKLQNIKAAVIQMVQQEGIQGASVSKIAQAAGVSPATVYIYYENKDAMLRDIYQEYAEQAIHDTLDNIRDDMDGIDREDAECENC